MSVISDNSDVPVSVKCRIGVDNHDSYNELCKVLFTGFFVFVHFKVNNDIVLSDNFKYFDKTFRSYWRALLIQALIPCNGY